MRFSRQEYWSRLPCPSPRVLPNPAIEPMSLMSPALAGRFFTSSTIWEAWMQMSDHCVGDRLILWGAVRSVCCEAVVWRRTLHLVPTLCLSLYPHLLPWSSVVHLLTDLSTGFGQWGVSRCDVSRGLKPPRALGCDLLILWHRHKNIGGLACWRVRVRGTELIHPCNLSRNQSRSCNSQTTPGCVTELKQGSRASRPNPSWAQRVKSKCLLSYDDGGFPNGTVVI